jgi:hypothetical protein
MASPPRPETLGRPEETGWPAGYAPGATRAAPGATGRVAGLVACPDTGVPIAALKGVACVWAGACDTAFDPTWPHSPVVAPSTEAPKIDTGASTGGS